MTAQQAILTTLLTASGYGSLLALLILLLQKIAGRHLSANFRFALWFLVLIRLTAVPLPQSRFSLLNFLPHTQPIAAPKLPLAATIELPPVAKSQNPDPAFSFPPEARPSDPNFSYDPKAHHDDPKFSYNPAPPIPDPQLLPKLVPLLTPHLTPPPSPPLWPALLLTFYLAIAAVILLRQLLATLSLRQLIRHATPATDPDLLASLHRAQSTLKIRRQLPLLLTHSLASPALAGLLKPRLLLPSHLLTALSPTDLHFIFLHECAHFRRRDILLNYWLALLSAVHWFNPLLWLLLPRIKADRELATDELVLRHTHSPADYGHTLLKLLESSPPAPSLRPTPNAISILDSKSFLKRRIHMIASFRRTPAWLALPALAALLLLAAATLTSALTKAADQPPAIQADARESTNNASLAEAVRQARATLSGFEHLQDAQNNTVTADALLNREIKKLKAFKETITGNKPDDQSMRAELDAETTFMEKFLGKPFPTPADNLLGPQWVRGHDGGLEPTSQSLLAQKLLAALWNKEHLYNSEFHADRQPLASLIVQLQEQMFDLLFPSGSYGVLASDPRQLIIELYRDQTFTINWNDLEAAGIHPDTVVSVNSSDYATTILQTVLSKLKAPNAYIMVHKNNYLATDGMRQNLPGITLDIRTSAVYNVRDLLAPVPSKQVHGLSVAGNPDDLIKAIRSACSPQWWKSSAKDDSIIQFKGIMTIITTPEIHQQILALLDTLRQADRDDTLPPKTVGSATTPSVPDATRPGASAIRPAPHAGDDGEIYVTGAVARPGVYSVSGRQLTLKQAVAAADLKPDPKSASITVTITRRDADNQETIIKTNLNAILDGTDRDYFLQPNDILNVTSPAISKEYAPASMPASGATQSAPAPVSSPTINDDHSADSAKWDPSVALTQPAKAGQKQEYCILGVPRPGLGGYFLLEPKETLHSALKKAGYQGNGKGLSVAVRRKTELTTFELSKVLDEKNASSSNPEIKHGDILIVATTEEINQMKEESSQPHAKPTAPATQAAAPVTTFPHPVPFDLGDAQFLPGDNITITEIKGTADTITPNNTYQIKGTYTLGSHPHAKLAAYVTAADPTDPTHTHHDPYDSRQTILIDKGTGTFTLVLPFLSKGHPHLSFYPTEAGPSFSALYFGTGDSLLKPLGTQ